MQKTIKQWFEECTESWAAHATQYMKEDGKSENLYCEYLSEALFFAFDWGETLEGGEYWSLICFSMKNKGL